MRLHEILTEEQLDELNRRDFLKQAGWAAMAAGLTAASLDQGAHADEKDEEEDDEQLEEQTREDQEEEYRRDGFRDARDGVFRPEAYAKGWARDAYREGKDDWVAFMASER